MNRILDECGKLAWFVAFTAGIFAALWAVFVAVNATMVLLQGGR